MAAHHDFLEQLENFGHEAEEVAQYVYADMSVQHATSKSRKLLNRLNRARTRTSTIWSRSDSRVVAAGCLPACASRGSLALLHNGKKPVIRIGRYSAKAIHDATVQRTTSHECIVGQTKKLMEFIEHATPPAYAEWTLACARRTNG